MSYQAAVHAINSADIKPSAKLFAVALLSTVDPATGSAHLSWASLTEGISRKTLRNRLASLTAAGILDYKTGSDIFIMFPSWGDKIPPTGDRIPQGGDSQSFDQSPPQGKSPTGGIKSPPQGTESPQGGTNAHHVSLLDHTSPSTQMDNKLTAPERKANLALLADANVNGFNRTAIANRYSFPELMAHVMAYRAELSLGKVKGPGALVSRCLRRYGVDPITGAAPVDELYDKHVTPQALATYAAGMPAPGSTKWTILAADFEADNRRYGLFLENQKPESIPDDTPRPNNNSQFSILNSNLPTPHPEGQAIWEEAVALIRPTCTRSLMAAIDSAICTDYQNGNGVHLTLTAPPESLDFLQSQSRALIRRALGQVKQTGQVDLRIIPR